MNNVTILRHSLMPLITAKVTTQYECTGHKTVFYVSLQILFKTVFSSINIWRITFKLHIEMHIRLYVKWLLKLSKLTTFFLIWSGVRLSPPGTPVII
jgi:hypothetical protein